MLRDFRNMTGIAALCATSISLGTVTNEVEPNDSKAAANPLVAPLVPGDTIVGTTTGSSTTVPGIGSADYFLVRTDPAPAGVYRHRLVITSSTVGHTGTIRGLGQVGAAQAPWYPSQVVGTANTSDAAAQTTSTTTVPARTLQWYGFGAGEEVYVSVAGTATTTAPYTMTYEREVVAIEDLGSFNPGTIVIKTLGQGHITDTDLWIYDSNYGAIIGFGNDDEAATAISEVPGTTGGSLQSAIARTFEAGTYVLALSNFNLMNSSPSPCDDDYRAGALLDFPFAVANSSTATNVDISFEISDGKNVNSVAATQLGSFDINFFRFTVGGPEPCTADLDGDGTVGASDLALLLAAWGTKDPYFDLAGDGGPVGASDLSVLLASWGDCIEVPGWATVLEVAPDPAVVTNAAYRAAIVATGLPWRVRDNASQIEMLLIPPGTFNMGCSASNQYACASDGRESPVHAVTLTDAFYLGRYEVTQAQWTAVMGSNPSNFVDASAEVPAGQVSLRPVERVSWNMIQGFNTTTGLRLPTEAEWEYAYRAGTTTAFHSFSGYPNGTNDDALLGNIAWFNQQGGFQTRPVGGKQANALGLHDMSGNVWEMVNDGYLSTYYQTSPSVNPPGSGGGSGLTRVLRGGSWNNDSYYCRSSNRADTSPGFVSGNVGFRAARTPFPTLSITGVSPNTGPQAGGTMITITGGGFTGASEVFVAGVAATGVTVVNATTITAVTPAGTAGPASVVVISPYDGLAVASNAFTYFVPVSSWATVLEVAPDPAVVTNAAYRAAIVATGLPWRVRDNASQIEMLLIPPGTFNMGCSASTQWSCQSDENPVHEVTLTDAFYLSRYEVTQVQWQGVMGSNPSAFQSASAQVPAGQVPLRPVERVTWDMILSFNTATGLRLPTEAEWEYAYRAGTTTAFHSFPGYPNGTNDDTLLGNIAWFSPGAAGQTRPVGGKQANALGLHDMSGNVLEWVNDWHSSTYYQSSPSANPPGPSTGTYRVMRGGSWPSSSGGCRSSDRDSNTPGFVSSNFGFRAARTPFPTLSITGVSPNTGPQAGGTMITITGEGFTGASEVLVAGVAATGVTVVNATTITAVTPAGTAGPASVAVIAPYDGLAVASNAFTYFVPDTSWATVLEAAPDPAVVTNAAYRAAIVATGLPWRVRDNASQIEMLLIPLGTFNMGCSASNQYGCDDDETPVHAVTLTNAFYLGRYEVTQAQWTAVMGSNPSYFVNSSTQVPAAQVPLRPVERVSWNMIQGFNTATGLRLPTEAEWEYAYRAGTTTAFHSFSGYPNGTNDDTLLGNIAWFWTGNCSGGAMCQTRPVGGKQANALGLHDMSGNVDEWVNDRYDSTYYQYSPSVNPPGPAWDPTRVLRGGSGYNESDGCRSSNREHNAPGYVSSSNGFRAARTP